MFAWLSMLAVFAGLSMNLVLQLGMGIREIALAEKHVPGTTVAMKGLVPRLCAFFVSVLLLWLGFSMARSLLPLGFLEYLLVFPVGLLAAAGLEHLDLPRGGRKAAGGESFGGVSIGAALFVTLMVADGFAEALVLSLGFALGTLLSVTVVAEIRRRSEMEAVPRWLRGAPLVLVAMGLLSLVFSSAAMMFFEVLGNG